MKYKSSSIRRYLIAFLSMIFVVFTVVGGSLGGHKVQAAEGYYGFESYLADYYCNGSFDYLLNEFKNPYRSIVEAKESSRYYQTMLANWEILTFSLGEVGEEVNKQTAYYETILYDILYQGCESASLFEDADNYLKSMNTSTWAKVMELFESERTITLADTDQDELQSIMKELNKEQYLDDSLSQIGDIADVIGSVHDVEDLVGKVAKAYIISSYSKDYVEVLQEMYSNTNNTPLKKALQNMIGICKDSFSIEDIFKVLEKEGTSTIINEIFSKVEGKVIKDCNLYGLAIKVGQGLGKIAANALFATESEFSLYYSMSALNEFDGILESMVKTRQKNFLQNKTIYNARRFNHAASLYLRVVRLGLDYTKQYCDLFEEGVASYIITSIRNKGEEYTKYKNSIDSIEKRIDTINRFVNQQAPQTYNDIYCKKEAEELSIERINATVSSSDNQVALEILKKENTLCNNLIVTTGMKLNIDMETLGDIYIKYGDFDLNGHTVTVHGDFIHSAGALKLNKGKLFIGGDYRLQYRTKNSAGETIYDASVGELYMEYDEDELTVSGDCYVNVTTYKPIHLSAGVMKLEGNLTAESAYFEAKGTHRIILGNKKRHVITMTSNQMNQLEVEPGAEITWIGIMAIYKLESDMKLQSKDLTIDNIALQGHRVQVEGDVQLGYATVDLGKGSLEIQGDLIQGAGIMRVNKGKLQIGGDYRLQKKTKDSAGDTIYEPASGELYMEYDEDELTVSGDCYVNVIKYKPIHLSAGVMRLEGNLTAESAYFEAKGTHRIILGNKKRHVITMTSNQMNQLEVEPGAEITWIGIMAIYKLESDMKLQSKDLTIDNISLQGHRVQVEGDVQLGYATVDLGKGSLEIQGDLIQGAGIMRVNKGKLQIGGDYRLQKKTKDSTGDTIYETASGEFIMQYEEDKVEIARDLYVQMLNDSRIKLTAGTITVGEDVNLISFFQAEGSHKLRLEKGKSHKINSNLASVINELEVESQAGLTWNGYMRVNKMLSDTMIESEHLNIGGLNLNGYKTTIHGDVKIQNAQVDLHKGCFTVIGNVQQMDSDIVFNKGQLEVQGEYRLQGSTTDSLGDEVYGATSGGLRMQYNEDVFRVKGNFIIQSRNKSTLSDGTFELTGDFEQLNGADDCFKASGTHTTILNGTGLQHISFASSNSYFNQLILTKDKDTGYVFHPDPCWKILEHSYEVAVKNGSGSDFYKEGDVVTVKANTPIEGSVFDCWKVISGQVALTDAKKEETTFLMPASNVELEAVYRKKEPIRILSSIVAVKKKTTYTVGDALGMNDLTVTAHYSDGSKEEVSKAVKIEISSVSMEKAGTYNIRITYRDKTTYVLIQVQPISVKALKIKLERNSYEWTEKPVCPKVTVSGKTGNPLRVNKDYKVTYKNNTKEGDASVIITGISNYKDSITCKYSIVVTKKKTYTVKGMKYTIIKKAAGKMPGTVSVTGASSSGITKLKIGKSITIGGKGYLIVEIGAGAFAGYKKLKSVTVEKNVKEISKNAFKGCTSLKAVYGNASLETINDSAFEKCKNLSLLQGCSKLSKIGAKAFLDCSSIKKVSLPSIWKIGSQAFQNDYKLSEIRITSKKLKSVGKNVIKKIGSKATIYVPKTKEKQYKKLFDSKSGFTRKMKLRIIK